MPQHLQTPPRWSDDELSQFQAEFSRFRETFNDHMTVDDTAHRQQQELYDAVFRKADKDLGTPPGLLQCTSQIVDQLDNMQKWQDRQKSFVGGVVFAISAVWFFMTDTGPKLLGFLKRVL